MKKDYITPELFIEDFDITDVISQEADISNIPNDEWWLEKSYIAIIKLIYKRISKQNRSRWLINRSLYGLCKRVPSKRLYENDEIII